MKAQTGFTFVAGAVLGAIIRHLIPKFRFGEERPAMIIKNGSITFENYGNTIGWVEDDEGWHPDHCEGMKVRSLCATTMNADKGCTTQLEGKKLTVTYSDNSGNTGNTHEFEVNANGNKPKIKPKKDKDELDHDTKSKKLKFGVPGEGQIISVELGGKACTFSDRTGEIRIEYVYV